MSGLTLLRYLLIPAVVVASAMPATLRAQSTWGRALMVTSDQEVGIVLPVARRLALRPDARFEYRVTSGGFPRSRAWFAVVGVSLLHTLHEDERLTTYLAPRIGTVLDGYEPDPGGESTNVNVSLAYGASGRITDRLSVFGEVGPEFDYTENSPVVGPPPTIVFRRWLVGTRLGVTIRF